MNPYLIPVFIIPALLTVKASLSPNKLWKWTLLLLAVITFWGILLPSVDWAYSSPVNTNDGSPRAFALLFGWAYGLILVVIPTYWTSKGIQWIVKKNKKGNC